jgi:hypothetical protein
LVFGVASDRAIEILLLPDGTDLPTALSNALGREGLPAESDNHPVKIMA